MIVGYTSGVFDFFHEGHKRFLEQCMAKCDVLYIGIDCDSRVKRRKGKLRPIENQNKRLARIIETYPKAFIKVHNSMFYISKIRPDIIFESSEKEEPMSALKSISRVVIPYTEGISTTQLFKKYIHMDSFQ